MSVNKMSIRLNTGALMPSLGMGTWHHGPRHEIENAVKYAVRIGYRHIDCAKIYLNEAQMGRVFKEMIGTEFPRKELFIVGKLWSTDHHPRDVETACRKSLSDLQIDYFDLYLIHWPSSFEKDGDELWPKHEDGSFRFADDIEPVDTWKAMEKLVHLGLVRAIGLSNFNSKQMNDIFDSCRIPPAVLHAECNPRFSNEALRRYCEKNNIVMIAFSPFGSPDLPWGEKMPHILDDPIIEKIADKHQRSSAQVVLRWLFQRGVATVPKSVIESEIRDNLKAFEFKLSDEEMGQINSLNKDMRKIIPVVKLKSGQVAVRDINSRHYPFAFQEKLE